MEKKFVALVFIALLGGLGGGYGLGYTVYQPQNQNLQEALDNLNDKVETINSTLQNELNNLNFKVTNLNSTIEEMENKTWHFVASFTLKENTSTLFLIQGEKWRILYDLGGYISGTGGAGFKVFSENGFAIDYVNILTGSKGILYMVHGKGSYYIQTTNLYSPIAFTIESYQ